jgi:predicted ATP-binding protein involved in virulence
MISNELKVSRFKALEAEAKRRVRNGDSTSNFAADVVMLCDDFRILFNVCLSLRTTCTTLLSDYKKLITQTDEMIQKYEELEKRISDEGH